MRRLDTARRRTSRPTFAARAALVGRDRRRRSRRASPRSSPTCARAATPRCSSTRARFDGVEAAIGRGARDRRATNCARRSTRIPPAQRDALEAAARARPRLPRAPARGLRPQLELPRRRRHAARPEGHAARPRRHLRARRQGGVSVERADERDAGARWPASARSSWSCRRRGGERNPLVLAAARVAGVDRVFTIGGAQAVGALAYGTATVPRGRQDHRPRQRLRRQRQAARVRQRRHRHDRRAERDPGARRRHARRPTGSRWTCSARPSTTSWRRASCCAPTPATSTRCARRSSGCCRAMPRRDVIRASLEGRGALILTRSMEEACAISNRIAPEHLEVSARDPQRWEPLLRHAGAIFLGAYTSESLGDYCAGPNHVLPTVGHRALLVAARRLRLPEAQQPDRGQRARRARRSARSPPSSRYGEGLQAHARAAEMRLTMRLPKPARVPRNGASRIGRDARRRSQRHASCARTCSRCTPTRSSRAPGWSSSTRWRTRSGCPTALQRELGERLGRVAINRYPADCVGRRRRRAVARTSSCRRLRADARQRLRRADRSAARDGLRRARARRCSRRCRAS